MATATTADKIRNSSKGMMIYFGILMAVTIGAGGVSQCVNTQKAQPIVLSNWNTEISPEELNEEIAHIRTFNPYAQRIKDNSTITFLAIDAMLSTKAAERENFKVSDEELKNEIAKNTQFHGENGKFDPDKYDHILQQIIRAAPGTNILEIRSIYERFERKRLVRKKLYDSITEKVTVSENELREDFHNKFDTLEYDLISLKLAKDKAKAPTEEEIKKYFEESKTLPFLQTKEQIKINYVFIANESFETKVDVTEEEMVKDYEANKEDYLIPTKPEVEKKNKEENKVTVKEYKEFKKVKDSIKLKLIRSKAQDKARAHADDVLTKLSAITNKETNEVELRKSYDKVNPEAATYGESDYFTSSDQGGEDLVAVVGDISTLRSVAFNKKGSPSLDKLITDKGVIIYRTPETNIKKSEPMTLEQAKPVIIERLTEKNAWDDLKTNADAIVEEAKTNGWEKTIQDKSLTTVKNKVAIDEAVGRASTVIEELLDAKATVGQILSVKSSDLEKAYYVVHFKDRVKAADAKFEEEKDKIQERLLSSKKQDVLSKYREGLPKEAGYNPEIFAGN